MTNYAEEYFYMIPYGSSYPLLDFVDAMTDSFLLFKEDALDEKHLFSFCFGDPVPHNPKMGDVHCNAQHLVISDRIKNSLESMQLKDAQCLPATIEDTKNNKILSGYWALHIHNLIHCMDRQESDFQVNKKGIVKWVDKLVIDNNALGEVSLEKRLVFALGEDSLQQCFHKSVVEKILAINPEGVRFAPVVNWDSKSLFEQAYWEYILS